MTTNKERAFRRFQKTITILAVVGDGADVLDDGKPGHPAGLAFWVHTDGMYKHDRPELEIRGVPALYVNEACALLNYYGFSVSQTSIVPGELVNDNNALVRVALRATRSTDPFWDGHPTGAVTLAVERVFCSCEGCARADAERER